MVAIDKNALVTVFQLRQRIEAIASEHRHACVSRIFGIEVKFQARVDDRVGDVWEVKQPMCGGSILGAYLTKALPAEFPGKRCNDVQNKLIPAIVWNIGLGALAIGFVYFTLAYTLGAA